MRRAYALAAPLLLAGCLGAAGPGPGTPAVVATDSYDESTVVSNDPIGTELHTGDYLWECFAPEVNGGKGWQFLIRKQTNETGSEIVLATDGVAAVTPLDRQTDGGKDVYLARSGAGRVAVAPMGAAQIVWPGIGSVPGHCHEGEQS